MTTVRTDVSYRRLLTFLRQLLTAPCQLLVVLTALLLVASACGTAESVEDSPQEQGPEITVDQELRALLPADVVQRGNLRVGTDASYAPMESFADDGRTIIGVDPDIMAAIGEVLDLGIVMISENFSLLPDILDQGRVDVLMAAITDTAEREESMDFVNYFKAGTTIVVQRDNPQMITGLETLCGHHVSAEAGSTQIDLLERQQFRCERPINVVPGATNAESLLFLRTGRVDAVLMDYPPAEQLTSDPATHAIYELAITTQYEPGLYGIALHKSDEGLRDAIFGALQQLHSSGVYESILFRWGVGGGAVTEISINAAGKTAG